MAKAETGARREARSSKPASKAKSDRRVALLRGINVGKAKRIAMADLKALFEELGYRDVQTLLNSGNVAFTVPASSKGDAGARVERALIERIGVPARVTVLTAAELDAIVEENPLLSIAKDPSRLLVVVPSTMKDKAKLEPLLDEPWKPDALACGRRAAYAWCAKGVLESPLAIRIGRELRDAVTSRNWATVLKLQALARDGA